MPLLIVCPECEAKYRVPETMQGKSVTCKSCGVAFKVGPDARSVPASPGAATPVKPEIRPRPRQDDEEDDDDREPVTRKKTPAKFAPPANARRRPRDDDDEDEADDDEDDRPRRGSRSRSEPSKLIGTKKGGLIAGVAGVVLSLIFGITMYLAMMEEASKMGLGNDIPQKKGR